MFIVAAKSRDPIYREQNVSELKGDINNNIQNLTTIVGYFNTSLSVMDRVTGENPTWIQRT